MSRDFALLCRPGWSLVAAAALAVVGCAERDEPTEVSDGTQDSEVEGDIANADQAIWYGSSAVSNLAVVELQRYRPGQSNAYCTGFFITRRHILTAAHCVDGTYANAWYQVRIKTGYGTYTNLKDTGRADNWVLMNEAEAPGWNVAAQDRARDTAILTIPTTAAASVPAAQQLLRISTAAPVIGQLLDIWGWGIRIPGSTPPGDLQSGNGGAQITVSGIATSGTYNWMYAYINNNARTCQGDSGGPATRYYAGYYIAVGDHRGPYYNDGSGTPWPCGEMGVRLDWATLYDKATWIESVLRGVYGAAFSCSRFGAGSDAYMRCF